MRVYTAHLSPDLPSPRLLREGFSLGAFILGPIWLVAHRAWIPAILTGCAYIALGFLARGPIGLAIGGAIAWLIGLSGYDMVRWTLERRGYWLAHVVEARNEDGAMFRLLDNRPDLIAEAKRMEMPR